MSHSPVRCFTCGKPLNYKKYYEETKRMSSYDEALDNLGYRRICCRRMFKGHCRQYEEIMDLYESAKGNQPRINLSK